MRNHFLLIRCHKCRKTFLMKNILFSTLILFTYFAFSSCNKKDTSVKEQVSLEQILEYSNNDHAKLTSGKIIIDDLDDLKIIAIVENDNAEQHTAYYYQLEGAVDFPNEIIDNGTILFLEDHLLIRDNNSKKHYSIGLIDQPFKQNSAHSSLILDREVESIGIGETEVSLTENISSYRNLNYVIVPVMGTCKCKSNNIIPGANCQVGGRGAPFCFCCGCFVYCSSGYYACCNP